MEGKSPPVLVTVPLNWAVLSCTSDGAVAMTSGAEALTVILRVSSRREPSGYITWRRTSNSPATSGDPVMAPVSRSMLMPPGRLSAAKPAGFLVALSL